MKNKLKDFFKNHIEEKKEDPVLTDNTMNKEQTYDEWGFDMAKNHHGNLLSFKGGLQLVKENYSKIEHADKLKLEEEKLKYEKELSTVEADINGKNLDIESNKKKIENLKGKIESCKRDIIRIEENPESVMKDKTSKMGFVIGLFILFFLTVYLFIFYSSASYSGFFKKFADGDNIASSIFDAKALEKALEAGTTELILILTIPFIFLGLGYLIHKFQEGKGFSKYFKIGFLILVTFAFDALLAYKIEKGLYGVTRTNSFDSLPPHTMEMAFTSENFWLVIFAGFIVYIIWGFLFDFVMEGYDKLDVVRQAIKAKRTEIKIYQEDIDNNEGKIEKLENEITELKKKSTGLMSIINGKIVIIDWTALEKVLLEFVNGWTHWMTANKIDKMRIDDIWLAHTKFVEQHKEKISKTN